MTIVLSPETQRLLEERMKATGVSTPDEMVRMALQSLAAEEPPELDPETEAAIDEGIARADRGDVLPWPEVREALRRRFLKEE